MVTNQQDGSNLVLAKNIDPVCLIHGLKYSEHRCLYCCLCFSTLTEDQCHTREDGVKEDVCIPCANHERLYVCDRYKINPEDVDELTTRQIVEKYGNTPAIHN